MSTFLINTINEEIYNIFGNEFISPEYYTQGRINSGRGPGATSVVEAPNSYYKCAVKNEI